MIRWMEAYREGKGAKEAQIQVKKSSSQAQSSHPISQSTLHKHLIRLDVPIWLILLYQVISP
jgi:hypothetical protein